MVLRQFFTFLAPSVVATVVSLVMIPVTTYVLGPEAFGVFGLMNALVAIGLTVSVLGSSAICNQHFTALNRAERTPLMSTALFLALGMAAAFCALCAAAWTLIAGHLDGYGSVSTRDFVLSLAAVVCGVPWVVAQDVITLDGKGRSFAVTAVSQTVVTALVTTTGLYVWDLGVTALFVSMLAAAAVGAVGGIWVLRHYLAPTFSRSWMRAIAVTGLATGTANVTEALQANVERGVIAATLGLPALGVYIHAQFYRTLIAQVLKAAARPIWPITLAEAVGERPGFRRTRAAWDACYVGVTAVGITFAFFGRAIIDGLTHGRFGAAADIVTFLSIFLLVQNAGKPQAGILFSAGVAHRFYWIQVLTNVLWLALLLALVPAAGLIGAVLALVGQQALLRAGAHVLARRSGAPMSDGWILAGAGAILAAWLVARWTGAAWIDGVAWLTSIALLTAASRGVLRRFFAEHVWSQHAASSTTGHELDESLWIAR